MTPMMTSGRAHVATIMTSRAAGDASEEPPFTHGPSDGGGDRASMASPPVTTPSTIIAGSQGRPDAPVDAVRGIERLQVHRRDGVDDKPREVPLWQPLADVEWAASIPTALPSRR